MSSKMRHADLPDDLNDLSYAIIGAAIEVHRVLGPGLLESVYRNALAHELRLRGMRASAEQTVPVEYKGVEVGEPKKIDLVVEEKVVVELKVVDSIHPKHMAQTRTYVQLAGKPLGLLFNFNAAVLRDDWRRILPTSTLRSSTEWTPGDAQHTSTPAPSPE